MDDAANDEWSFENLREFEPIDWPGRQIVEQDTMGDWGAWLSFFDGEFQDCLLEPDGDCRSLAEMMAHEYIMKCESEGHPLPADFDETGDREAAKRADYEAVVAEFETYLRAWRAAIVQGRKRS